MFEQFKKHYYGRCNADKYVSILQDDLLKCVKINDTDAIIKIPKEILNLKIFPNKDHRSRKPILQIACCELAETVFPKTVETLINHGADLNYFNAEDGNKEALHYAVSSLKPLLVEVLINKFDSPDRINALANGDTPLNLLIKQAKNETLDYTQCLRHLLLNATHVNINKADNQYITPILHAARKKFKSTVNRLLKTPGIDLDNHFLPNGKNARTLIEENNLFEGTLPECVDPGLDVLFKYVKFGEIKRLTDYPDVDLHVDYFDEEGTLLQYACKNQHRSVVEFLIEKGCKIDGTTRKNSEMPIQIAGRTKNVHILRLLAEKHVQESKPVQGHVLAGFFLTFDDDIINLLSDVLSTNVKFVERSSINAKNETGNTSLHYTTRYGYDDLTLILLKLGASLTIKNKLGFKPIDYIGPQVLEQCFDNCVKIKRENVITTVYEFDYTVLLPVKDVRRGNEKQRRNEEVPLLETKTCDLNFENRRITDESEVVYTIGNEKTETCDLYFENKRITESEVVYTISNRSKLRHLLIHPLIASFMELDWKRKWCKIFWANLLLYVFFCLCLGFYIAYYPLYLYKPLLAVGLSLLLIREMFQIFMSWRLYLKLKENWLELVLILLSFRLFFPLYPPWDRVLPQLIILLATGELMLLIGQHPQVATYFAVFYKVLKNFFKYFLLYFIILVAFAFSFWKHFGANEQNKTDGNVPNNKTDCCDVPNLFGNFPLSLNKILVMLSGELEASSFLDTSDIIGQIMLAVLVFTVTIVLANLLSALAIIDAQEILNESEINGYRARLGHVIYMEQILPRWLNQKVIYERKVTQRGRKRTDINENVLQRAISLKEKSDEETKQEKSNTLSRRHDTENRKDMQELMQGLMNDVKKIMESVKTLQDDIHELKAEASN